MNVIRKVGLKGEVTIPKNLRERLDIRPGTVVSFDSDSEAIFIFRQKRMGSRRVPHHTRSTSLRKTLK